MPLLSLRGVPTKQSFLSVYYGPANRMRKQMETNAYDVEINLAKAQGNTELFNPRFG
jgi:hypothetical protein